MQEVVTGKETLSLEDVRSALHIREDRKQAASSATESQASGLSATGTGQKKSGKKKSKSKGGSKGFQPGDICRYCKESGHWQYDCPKKKMKDGKKEDANGSVTVAEADDSDSEVSLALVADDQPHSNDVWIFDSGASYHLCLHREYFTTYEQIDGGNITMANNVVCKVVGIGSIRIRTHGGVFCTLNDVRHVPQMTKNLISLSTFGSKGFGFKVIHNRNVVFDENSMLNSVVKSVGVEDSSSVDKQVELQVTHNESESQLQGGEDQHTTAETTGSDIHPEARQRSIAIDKARRIGVKPPQK
ncbi:hypothetical protein SASPL_100905 [Salvia splendens]|uniref:CCHC-type domain-containing protein n=1 Tax=Salvia splendens TaxID=180675 RepID=A0A8X8YPY6_SALSN|nr:hypothetical protein SASPL_100905 [Salvia splendens]